MYCMFVRRLGCLCAKSRWGDALFKACNGKHMLVYCEVGRPVILPTCPTCVSTCRWKEKKTRCRNVQRLEPTAKGMLCVNNSATHIFCLRPCALVCSGFVLRTTVFIAMGSSPRDGDLLLVTAWPAYPQATLCVCVCVCVCACVCGTWQGFLTGLCWINEQSRFRISRLTQLVRHTLGFFFCLFFPLVCLWLIPNVHLRFGPVWSAINHVWYDGWNAD